MKIKTGVLTILAAMLLLFAVAAVAQQGSMQDQQQTDQQQMDQQQGATTQDSQTVKQVQQALSDRGYNPGPVDGKWKSETESALTQFQQAQGMEATGQLDQQTLASLGVEGGAAAGGQEGEMTDQQAPMAPDQSGAGAPQGGSRY